MLSLPTLGERKGNRVKSFRIHVTRWSFEGPSISNKLLTREKCYRMPRTKNTNTGPKIFHSIP